MKIIAFAASTHSRSINKQLVSYVAHRVPGAEVEILDLNDYPLPLFSEDIEREIGQPQLASDFLAKLASSDAIFVSFAEHNGLYTAAFKNLFDWCSRQAGSNIYQGKPMILLATSPGARGGKSVLELATFASPRFGGEVIGSVSVPLFNDNFSQTSQALTNADFIKQIDQAISRLVVT